MRLHFTLRPARRLVAALVCALPLATGVARAQADRDGLPKKPIVVGVQAGIDGAYKLGAWTPVRLDIAASDVTQAAQLILATVDGDGIPCSYPPQSLQLNAGRLTSVVGYIRFGKAEPAITASLLCEHDGLIVETLTTDSFDERPHIEYPVSVGNRLVVCIGRSATTLELADVVLRGNPNANRMHVAQINDVLNLPTRASAYEAVDAVVVAADVLKRYAPLTADSAQVQALREYVEFGGRLFVVAGDDARTLLGAGGPLAAVCGLKTDDAVPLPRAAALEEYVGGNKPIGARAADLAQLRIPRAVEPAGVVELAEGDLPLVVRKAVGFGAVTWIMVDLDKPLLADWSGRPLLLGKVMSGALGKPNIPGLQNSAPPASNSYNYGFSDLAGQLHQAVDQYAGVQVVPFFALALLVIVYIAVIGPGDYLLVRNLLKRTELTWLTFPTIVLVTSVAAYYAAVWLKGDQLRVHQADVVDCDAESGVVHGTSFAGVFSPVSRTYDVRFEFPPELLAAGAAKGKQITEWFGAPGEGLGGMHRRDMGPSWLSSTYGFSNDLSQLEGAPIKVWSSKLFAGDWRGRAPGRLHANLRETADGRPTGKLVNPFRTALEPSLLCYRSTALKVPRLEPGASCELDSLESRDLQGVLANAEILVRRQRELSPGVRLQPHDVSSLDPAEILAKVMFYDSLGGEEHAGLTNDELKQLDFSELLKLRRAVLVAPLGDAAPAAAPSLHVSVDGQDVDREHDRHGTIVRLTIPVEAAKPE